MEVMTKVRILAGVLLLCATLAQAAEPTAAAPKANEVVGLSLPAPQEVSYDEGFISLKAECKGTVKWLVLSTSVKVKFKVAAATPNEIDIAIPPHEAGIAVFAVGLVDGKQTDFARTDLSVKGPAGPGPPGPGPGPGPGPTPPDVAFPLHLSIIEDPLKRTVEIRNVIESPELRARLEVKNVKTRVYSTGDPELARKRFDAVLQKYGAPLLILSDNNGKALVIQTLPGSAAGVLQIVGQFVGGQ